MSHVAHGIALLHGLIPKLENTALRTSRYDPVAYGIGIDTPRKPLCAQTELQRVLNETGLFFSLLYVNK